MCIRDRLQPPKRGGKRHNLTATIKSRISSFAATVPLNATVDPRHDKRHRAIRDSQLSQAVAAKLEDGNVTVAVRLLMSNLPVILWPSYKKSIRRALLKPMTSLPPPQSRAYPWTSPKSVWRSSHFQLVLLEVRMV